MAAESALDQQAFRLDEEPWVLAQRRDGRVEQLSLADVFARAHELRAIVGELPTQTFALMRLLLAILHRAVEGPQTPADWRALWKDRTLPAAEVAAYLADYPERFDLFHPRTPFYQVADLRTGSGEVSGLEKIIADVPSGAPFLTSRAGRAASRLSPAEAARWLVHCQAFDVSGIKSGAVGDPRVKGGKGYPIGTGFAGSLGGVFVEGDSLRETLLLNLVPADIPYLQQDPDDAPIWELDPQDAREREDGDPRGVLALYTWQSRRVRLIGDRSGVTGVVLANGDRLAPQNRHWVEPMTGWRRSPTQEKALRIPTVYMPRTHAQDRALWRGLTALLPHTSGRPSRSEAADSLAPGVLQWIDMATNRGYLEADRRVRLRAIGAVYGTQQSVIDEVIDDAVAMSVQVVATDQLSATVASATADADQAVLELNRLAANLARAGGLREDKAIDGIRRRAAERAYSALDQHFRAWLAGLDASTDTAVARTDWQKTVSRVVRGHGDQLVASAGPAAWIGREVDGRHLTSAQADVWFRRALRKALPLAVNTNQEPKPQLESQADPNAAAPSSGQEIPSDQEKSPV